MGPAGLEVEDDEAEVEVEEEQFTGEVYDPTAPLETNVVEELVPRAPSPTPQPQTVRRPGRPLIRPPPVAQKHSLHAFFATAPKRPREEVVEIELQEQAVADLDADQQLN
eukprot:GFYU01001685.1.p1 GENE.GFYU01001685.1~~GFYU01001685.1.p1  ORF type:complete len:110 (-),score=3.85 GFYU01001685.1:14-343(-)